MAPMPERRSYRHVRWGEWLLMTAAVLALTLAPRVASRTLPVGITLYQGEFSFPWPIISAACCTGICHSVSLCGCMWRALFGWCVYGGTVLPFPTKVALGKDQSMQRIKQTGYCMMVNSL